MGKKKGTHGAHTSTVIIPVRCTAITRLEGEGTPALRRSLSELIVSETAAVSQVRQLYSFRYGSNRSTERRYGDRTADPEELRPRVEVRALQHQLHDSTDR